MLQKSKTRLFEHDDFKVLKFATSKTGVNVCIENKYIFIRKPNSQPKIAMLSCFCKLTDTNSLHTGV